MRKWQSIHVANSLSTSIQKDHCLLSVIFSWDTHNDLKYTQENKSDMETKVIWQKKYQKIQNLDTL